MAVGNVGEQLVGYTDSDTFMSRDAGFSWEEVHKDAHLFEFGDSGSILVMANDEEPTDHILFSTDEGLNWREYKFSNQPVRVKSIATVPQDTSRKFILFGYYGRSSSWLAVHIDMSSLTHKKCVLDLEDPGKDDFELWSPSEEREERCLFGRQVVVFVLPRIMVLTLLLNRPSTTVGLGIVTAMSGPNQRLLRRLSRIASA